jgi:hypothetical protein
MKYVAEVLTSVVTARGVLLPEHQQVLVDTQQAFEMLNIKNSARSG